MTDALETIIGARLQVIDEGAIASLQEFNDELADTASIMADAAKSAAKMAGSYTKLAAAQDAQTAAAGKNADANKASADANAEAAGTSATANKALTDATVAVDGATVAHTKLAPAITKTAKATSSFGDKVVALGSSGLGKIGKYSLVAGAAEAYEAIKTYSSVQVAMTKLNTLAGVPKKDSGKITNEAISLSKKYGISLNDMADATYRLASASVAAKHPLKNLQSLMPAFAMAATALQATPGAQTESLARMFGALEKGSQSGLQGVGSPQHVAAMLTSMAGAGDIQGTDLQSALGKGIILQGSALKLKAPDLMAYVDLATQYGQGPSTAGTLVSHALAMISNPSAAGVKTEEMFGIDQGTMRQLASSKGVPAAITYFNNQIKKGLNPTASLAPTSTTINGKIVHADQGTMSSAAYQLINWGVSVPTAQALLAGKQLTSSQETSLYNLVVGKSFGGGKQESTFLAASNNPKLYQDYANYIAGHSTKKQFDAKVAQTLNTPAYQEKVARNDLKVFQYDVGQTITPAWLTFLHAMEDVAKFLANHTNFLKGVIAAVGAIAGLGIISYVGGKAVKLGRGVTSVVQSVGSLFGTAGKNAPTVELGAAATSLDGAASTLLAAGEALQVAADRLMGGGIGGKPGAGGPVGAGEGAAEDAGIVGAEDAAEGAGGAGAVVAGSKLLAGGGAEGAAAGTAEAAAAEDAAVGGLGFGAGAVSAFAATYAAAYYAAKYGNTGSSSVGAGHLGNALNKVFTPLGLGVPNLGQTGVKNGKPTYGAFVPPTSVPGGMPTHTSTQPEKGANARLKNSIAFNKHLKSIENQPSHAMKNLSEGINFYKTQGIGPNIKNQVSSTAKSDSKQGDKDTAAAAKETASAAKDQQKAATTTGSASNKAQTAANQMTAAAKAHNTAAAELKAAAAALMSAIGKINTGQISANQLAGVVASLANKGNSNSAARGK